MADRINELERHNFNQSTGHNQKYTYLDPSKTTRVPNPALKAFQKNAVQSYFERQQQSGGKENLSTVIRGATATTPVSSGVGAMRPQSLPVNSPAAHQHSSRSSLPNNYQMAHAHLANNGALKVSPTASISSSQQQLNMLGSPAMLHSSMATTYHLATVATVYNGAQTTVASAVLSVPDTGGGMTETNGGISNGYLTGSQSMDALKSANESGVPPPPPRRGRSMVPLRR